MKKNIFLLTLLLLAGIIPKAIAQVPGYSMSNAINAGSYSASGSFSNSENSATGGFTNNYGNAANDVWYTFTINSTASTVLVSLCGSNFDTYLHVLNSSGTEIASNDDDGPACATVQSSVSLSSLAPGTYYVDAEGYSNSSGTIGFSLNVTIVPPPVISYPSGVHTYAVGTAISPLTSANTGSAVAAVNQTLTFAGTGSAGSADGNGSTASFNQSLGMTTDGQGNLYVADAGSHNIRKVTLSGNVTTLAGSGGPGYADGTGSAASFNHPVGLASDLSGNLYVADEDNNRIRKITPSGTVSTLAGNGLQGATDGNGAAASFYFPCGVAIDANGNVYVADAFNNKIRKITPLGVVTTLAGSGLAGSTDGAGAAASFNQPFSLTIDASGNLYVTDRASQKIRKVTPAGVVSTLAGSGSAGFADGTGNAASFSTPTSITIDGAGNLYVTDESNQRIRKVTSAGVVTTVAGNGTAGSANGVGTAATFNNPFAIAAAPSGYIYIGDYANYLLRKTITTPYTINPGLPSGLSLDPGSGTISGTPTDDIAATTYSVTAFGTTGQSAQAAVNIKVNSVPLLSFSPSQNYIAMYTPRIAGLTTNTMIYTNSADNSKVTVDIQYFDGLIRPLQSVQMKGSAGGRDMVQAIAYDQFGRQPIKYLPYAVTGSMPNDGSYKATAIADQATFYNSPPPAVVAMPMINGVTPSFSQSVFELSPMNRVTEQGGPGNPWQPVAGSMSGHTAKVSYQANDASSPGGATGYGVALYQVNIDASGNRTLVHTGNYAAGALSVITTANENWTSSQTNPKLNTVEQYKDLDGHIVLKRTFNHNNVTSQDEVLSTYYVYDDRGNLSFVLTPATSPDNVALSSAANQSTLDNLCYQYGYDERNRMTQKKIPGKGWEYTVYNRQDQPVLIQDANQRANNQWTVTKYDIQGRVILTGLWNAGSSVSLSSLEASIYAGAQYDLRSYSDNTTGYTITSYPAMSKILKINYYDDYNFPGGNPYPYVASSQVSPAMPATASTMTNGLPTASKIAILNTIGNATPDMLWSENYYDDLGRAIGTFKQHYLYGRQNVYNYDQYAFGFDFENNVVSGYRQNFASNNSNSAAISMATIANTYVYNNREVKIQTWEQVNGGTKILLNQKDYNEIGQLMDKKLHSANNGTSFFQSVNYAYNERGWLLSSTAPLFGMTLQYNTGANPQYNGNIISQNWTSSQSSGSFVYTYDVLNRLLSGTSGDNKYIEKSISYDLNGNITALSRTYNGNLIDNLIFSYLSGTNPTNQLQSVNDLSADASGTGYKTGNWAYGYDANGNMVSDNSNGITGTSGVVYNLLDLPQSIAAKSTTYTYDAGGNKLRRVVGTAQTDYIEGIQYDLNGATETISFIQTEDGQLLTPTTAPSYEYNLADQLGNTRLTFDTGTGIARTVQQDNYLPFGMEISVGSISGTKNEYLYNNKELQESLQWYDYGARFYNPVVGRWMVVDPLAEISRRMSPYIYVSNNPIRLIDPDGMHNFGSIANDQESDIDGGDLAKSPQLDDSDDDDSNWIHSVQDVDKSGKKDDNTITKDDNTTTIDNNSTAIVNNTATKEHFTDFDLGNGETVKVYFQDTKGNVSSDNAVSSTLVNAVEQAIIATNNSGLVPKIESLTISATSNGDHAPNSNHAKGLAVDIAAINGIHIKTGNVDATVQMLQVAFEFQKGRRENFGPIYMLKLGKEFLDITGLTSKQIDGRIKTAKDHMDHIHWSVNPD